MTPNDPTLLKPGIALLSLLTHHTHHRESVVAVVAVVAVVVAAPILIMSEDESVLSSVFYDPSQYMPVEELETKAVGGKTINYAGSFVLIANRFAGPGMIVLPYVYQQGTKRNMC
jgi:hypothetical protein